MLNFFKRKISSIFIIFCFLVIFGLGFWIGESSVICKFCQPEEVDFSLFWEAWDVLKENYIDIEKIDQQKMIYGAISGAIKSLNDPHTIFFNPEDAKKFLEDVRGRFEGVGMEVGVRDGQLKIIAPLEGTPAQRAGLRSGDVIVSIDGVSAFDITIEEAITLIRGPQGTEVCLTIFRDEWDSSKDIKIKRALIEIPVLKWEMIENDIAYIQLYHFSDIADVEFSQAIYEIFKTSADRIILDLRNNPGGYLEVSQTIAGWFLEKGQIVVIEDFGDGEEKIYKAKGNSRLLDYPIVILINEGSASASEILASALRDNRGIKIVGNKSFGKGSVQELQSLSDNSSLKITIASWLTSNGEHITGKGLEPDIEVDLTDEDYNNNRDPQLERAIEIIREIR